MSEADAPKPSASTGKGALERFECAPFPLEGGRTGVGGGEGSRSNASNQADAPDPLSPPGRAATPIPDPSPLQGEGRQGRRLHDAAEHKVSAARQLRKEQTFAEGRLWAELRALKQGWRRQAPIGRYVVDFVRHEVGLIVEVDGPVHALADHPERDAARQGWLEAQGYLVFRCSDADVANRTEAVVRRILDVSPRPRPSATRRGEARYEVR